MRGAIALLIATGCQPAYDRIAGQDEATRLVWVTRFAAGAHAPPDVQWLAQRELDCHPVAAGAFGGFFVSESYGSSAKSGLCVAGATWTDFGLCQVALPDRQAISSTAFAHELWHEALYVLYRKYDPDHSDPGFHTEGVVELANDDLVTAGL